MLEDFIFRNQQLSKLNSNQVNLLGNFANLIQIKFKG
jgi:hypothetical protein